MLTSRTEDKLRHDARSLEALARAIDTAAEQTLIHPFLLPHQWLTPLLRRHQQVVGTHQEFVARVLALRPDGSVSTSGGHVNPHAETLTERELSVLLHLPGMSSNTEIAAALNISANTVKQHLKTSYRKLGVGSRRDAVRIARDRGLLAN